MAIELSEQEQLRRQSLTALRNLGIEPYPAARYELPAHRSKLREITLHFRGTPISSRFFRRSLCGRAASPCGAMLATPRRYSTNDLAHRNRVIATTGQVFRSSSTSG